MTTKQCKNAGQKESCPLTRGTSSDGTLFQGLSLLALAFTMAAGPVQAQELRHGIRGVPNEAFQAPAKGHLSRSQTVNIALTLPLHDQDTLGSVLDALYDPESPYFHQWLSATDFTTLFGPTDDEVAAVVQFAADQGLTVTDIHANRMIVDVTGAVKDVENAFGVNLLTHSHPTEDRDFYGPDAIPSVPDGVPVVEVVGLDNFAQPHPKSHLQSGSLIRNATGSAPGGGYRGTDLRKAYAPGVTLDGTGQSIALVEFMTTCYPADLSNYCAQAGIPAVVLTNILLDGMSATPTGGSLEQSLDVEQAHSMAPGASIYFYLGNNASDIFNRIAADNTCKSVSCSYDVTPPPSTLSQVLQQMAAQGQSVFNASGDSGFTSPYGWNDNPYMTQVGGTILTTSGAGGPWLSETGWSGSGGCISTTFAIPTWQSGLASSTSGASTSKRNTPDVAMVADSLWTVYHTPTASASGMVGGTSASAPLWAGFTALANQQAVAAGKTTAGFINPVVYALAKGTGTISYRSSLHDITSGSNGKSAVAGYDLVTGVGTPAGQQLLNALSGVVVGSPSILLGASPSSLSVQQGVKGAVTLSLASSNGFNGSVTLSVAGLPSGATASFSPASLAMTANTATNVALSLTPGSATPAGTYLLAVKATSGTVTSSASVTLTVTAAPDFSVSASPSILTVTQGSSAASTLTITRVGTFTGTVSLSASGLPSGLSASFSPTSTTSSSKLTLSANGSTTAGTYTVTVKGVSGSLIHTTALTVTVARKSGSASK